MGNVQANQKDVFLSLCQNGDVAKLRVLLEEHHASAEHFLSFKDRNDMNGLHHASENGHEKVLELFLLDKRFDVDLLAATCRGNTLLHLAARANKIKCAQVILRAANKAWEQCRLLWIALRKDRFDNPSCAFARFNKDEIRLLCRYIMRDSLSLNNVILARNSDGLIPLEYALKCQSRAVLPILITPVSVAQVRGYLGSPLHYAAAKGSTEACMLLLTLGANVNELNERRETPIYRACCAYPEAEETVKVICKMRILFF